MKSTITTLVTQLSISALQPSACLLSVSAQQSQRVSLSEHPHLEISLPPLPLPLPSPPPCIQVKLGTCSTVNHFFSPRWPDFLTKQSILVHSLRRSTSKPTPVRAVVHEHASSSCVCASQRRCATYEVPYTVVYSIFICWGEYSFETLIEYSLQL